MRDISLHILDIAMNSIDGCASLIEITIIDEENEIIVKIKDNGCGMDENTLKKVLDPFYTSRKTRNVGLGLPLFYQNVKNTGGKFTIESKVNCGTNVEARFNKKHLDCIPLGNIKETILSLILLAPECDFIFTYKKNHNAYVLNTKEIKAIIKEVPINDLNVINWLKKDLVKLESL